MKLGAGNAWIIISWSLSENRERLVLQPCTIRVGVVTDPPAKYCSTYHNNATGRPDHHSIANYKELYRLPNVRGTITHACYIVKEYESNTFELSSVVRYLWPV